MNILIIEDESWAAEHLLDILKQTLPTAHFYTPIESVSEGLAFFKINPPVDLIISDIQLNDGLSFELYEQLKPQAPIIFTTAFNDYALQAFQTQGIAYLLKPISEVDLEAALDKWQGLKQGGQIQWQELSANHAPAKNEKQRFIVKIGDKLKAVDTHDILVIYNFEKGTYLFTKDHRNYLIDPSLDVVMEELSERTFFRISRKHIVHIKECTDLVNYNNSRLQVLLPELKGQSLVVAREKVKLFKEWLNH